MQGFCQWIGERAFIIRVGDATERMWHDWTKTLTATIEDDGHVMFWAWAGKGDRRLVESFVRQANIETSLPVEWLRKSEPDPILMRQISGVDGKGRIKMAAVQKTPIPNISELFNADGTPNHEKAAAGFMHAASQHAAGHIVISKGSATQTPVADGSVDIVIKFNRK